MSKNIIVIGGGFGGLSCAIRLQTAGHKVTLLEKRDKLGGRAYVYEEKGYKFDAGPTVITAPHVIEDLFIEAKRPMKDYIELLPVKPFYRLYWEDGVVFDYDNDQEKLVSQIKKLNPSDVEGYEKFLKYSKEVFNEGYTKLAHVPFLDWWSMIKVAPQLIKLQAHRSVYSIVSSFIKNDHLRQAFSFHSLLVGGNPFSTSSIYTLIHFLERNWGVFFPKGGTGALVQALGKLFTDLGGTVMLDSEVNEIITEDGKSKGVNLKNGKTLLSDLVVCNSEVMHTYRDLLKKNHSAQKKAASLKNSRFSMSLVVLYFGAKKRYTNLAHHNVIFGPRYKELLNDIFKNKVLADDFSLYLHAPTLTDPSLAPEGHEAFYVLSPVPHLGHLDIDWDKMGPIYADKILSYLEEKYLPDLKENLTTLRIFTPKDFKETLNSHLGSAFSLEPILTQSAYFRVHNRDDEIENLYFVGAGTHPGAGVPGVMNSGKATANLIISDLA
jgi:phytoene desaturase